MTKREKVLFEIVDTEKRFLSDMKVLNKVSMIIWLGLLLVVHISPLQVYTIPAAEHDILSSSDLKILFGNLNTVISTSSLLLEQLVSSYSGASAKSIPKILLDMVFLLH